MAEQAQFGDEFGAQSALSGGLERFLIDSYSRTVVALTAIAGDRAAAEDAVAEAVERGVRAIERGDGVDVWDRWIFVVARNVERNRMRRLRRRVVRVGPLVSHDTTAGVAEAQTVRGAVAGLPRRQREVTVMRYYLDQSVREIATTLSLSEGAVKNALFNARAALAEALDLDEESDQ